MSQTATCELVYSSSLDDLSDAVTSRMVDGWWPLGRPFTRGEHFIQAMVLSSAMAIFLALVPRFTYLFGKDFSAWRTATYIALVLGSIAMFLQARQQLRMSREEAVQIHWIWHVVAWVLGGVAALLFILALVDHSRTIDYYVAGVTALIPLSLWVFIGVVFRRFF